MESMYLSGYFWTWLTWLACCQVWGQSLFRFLDLANLTSSLPSLESTCCLTAVDSLIETTRSVIMFCNCVLLTLMHLMFHWKYILQLFFVKNRKISVTTPTVLYGRLCGALREESSILGQVVISRWLPSWCF